MWYMLVIVVCCLYVIRSLWTKDSQSEPPILPGWLPIIGHGYKIMGNGEQMLRGVINIVHECNKLGGVVAVSFGPRKSYCITDPDDCVTVMNACLQKHYFFEFGRPVLGEGLITADVPTWKKNRKLLNPAFNQQVLDGFIDIFNVQAERLVEQFTEEVGKPFDHEILLRVNNLETICSTSLGVYGTDNEYRDLFKQYLPHLSKAIHSINERVQKFWLHSDFIYNMTQAKRMFDIEVKNVTALSGLIIKKKRLDRQTKIENKSNDETKSAKFKPFIDLILDLADETGCFTDEQIKSETGTIIGGGHDTTSTILTFTLALLGSHPEVQEKAYQEIIHVLGSSNKNVSKDDLNRLEYIEAILKETLRLYLVAPVLPRYIDKDVKLKNYTIKAKSDCFIFIYGLHQHSMWGLDANQFRPERWLQKETLPDPKYFGAFGLGRRSCIGKAYAMMTMKVSLAHVLKKFHITSDISKMAVIMHIMIRPKSGHNITLTLRNQQGSQT